MNARLYRAVAAAIAASTAVAVTACGATGSSDGSREGASREGGFTIGVLLPGDAGGRERFDKPLIEEKVKELCGDCTVVQASAMEDVSTQRQQAETLFTKGVDVLILDAVDSRSARATVTNADQEGIPVVAYDRLAEGPISGYVSFDNEQVGKIQGESLLDALGDKADDSQIVMMNGPRTDPNAASFKKGALSVLKGRVKIGKAYDTTEWKPANATGNMAAAIAVLGADSIDGVYAANDGLASGVVPALKAAKIKPLPPVTGQDADLSAVLRIVLGEQYMTVYKPFKPQADAAAAMAVALGRGEDVDGIAETRVDNATVEDVPAVLLTPVPVTVDTIKDTLVKDGMYTINQICPPRLQSACEKAGLIP